MLAPIGFAERRHRIREAVAQQVVQGLPFVISSPPNVAYLTGVRASNAAVVIDPDGADLLCTDGRYVEMARAADPELPVVVARAATQQLVSEAAGQGHRRVAVEGSLSATLVEELSGMTSVIVCPGIVEQFRRVKDDHEISVLARACDITAAAFQQLAMEIRVGQSELFIARRLESIFAALGADDRAFPSIVATGSNAAVPHHVPGSRQIQAGDLLIIDAGAQVEGYHADMTRTFVVATEPSAEVSDWHDAVIAARSAAIRVCRAGAPIVAPDQAAAGTLASLGYLEWMQHGLGHGIGLEIHEGPMLTKPQGQAPDQERLALNMALAIEPGVYRPGVGGIRVEDSFVVTDHDPVVLTRTGHGEVPTTLQIVGESA